MIKQMLTSKQKNYFLQRLFKLLSIKSISADPNFRSESLRAVEFLKQELVEIGFKKKKIEELYADGLSEKTNNPVLYVERLVDPTKPTLLIYGHYDVQPPDPIDLWTTPPFEPVVRDGKIFARGATDDKGQLYTHLAALKIFSEKNGGKFPFNIKILIEGEEESGGVNIEKLVTENPQKFKANVCLISDTGFVAKDIPAIEIGLRGIVYFEMEVITGEKDLHSGIFGGSVRNPLNTIAKILSELETKFNNPKLIAIPENAKATCLDLHGIVGGFQGEGAKTVIPNKASAKFSVRLTPAQTPTKVIKMVRSFVEQRTLKGVDINLKVLGTGEAFLANDSGPYMQLALKSMGKIFGKTPELSRSGGSIPIVVTIAKKTGAEMILMGYGLPDDNLHSPNEKLDLDQFYKGIECNLEFLNQLSKLDKAP